MAADRLWERFLQHTEQFLTLPQYVTVVCALAETGASLEQLWLSQTQGSQAPAASQLAGSIPMPTCQAPLT